MQPAVFLDRDGVLNKLVERDGGRFSPRSMCDFEIFSWVKLSLKILSEAHFLIFVITNQPDIARGLMPISTLQDMHQELLDLGFIKKIYFCPHDSSDNCKCRKPDDGMIQNALEEYAIDLSRSWLIGDRVSDIQAGQKSGLNVVFVKNGEQKLPEGMNAPVEETLLAAAIRIAKQSRAN